MVLSDQPLGLVQVVAYVLQVDGPRLDRHPIGLKAEQPQVGAASPDPLVKSGRVRGLERPLGYDRRPPACCRFAAGDL